MKGMREVQRKASRKSYAKRAEGIMLSVKYKPGNSGVQLLELAKTSKYIRGNRRKQERQTKPSALQAFLTRIQKGLTK